MSATVPPGGALLIQVSLTAKYGFKDSATVTFTGVPAGITTTPAAPFTLAAGSQTMVTLLVAPSVAVTYPWNPKCNCSARTNRDNYPSDAFVEPTALISVGLTETARRIFE